MLWILLSLALCQGGFGVDGEGCSAGIPRPRNVSIENEGSFYSVRIEPPDVESGCTIASYSVFYRPINPGKRLLPWQEVTTPTTSARVPILDPSKSYWVKVQAVAEDGTRGKESRIAEPDIVYTFGIIEDFSIDRINSSAYRMTWSHGRNWRFDSKMFYSIGQDGPCVYGKCEKFESFDVPPQTTEHVFTGIDRPRYYLLSIASHYLSSPVSLRWEYVYPLGRGWYQ